MPFLVQWVDLSNSIPFLNIVSDDQDLLLKIMIALKSPQS